MTALTIIKKFILLKERSLIERIPLVCQKYKIKMTLWTEGQGFKDEAKVVELFPDTKSMRVTLAEDCPPIIFPEGIKAHMMDPTRVFVTMKIDHENYFFQSVCTRKISKKDLLVKQPKEIYKLDKKTAKRIPLPRSLSPVLTIPQDGKDLDVDSAFYKFRVLDLGVGGLAFACTVDHLQILKKNQIFETSHFRIKEHEIRVGFEIKYIRRIKNDRTRRALRVGVKFIDLKDADHEFIKKLVDEESRAQFMVLKAA